MAQNQAKSLAEPMAELLHRLADLESRLKDMQARLPAHSMSPAMYAALEALEEETSELRHRIENGGA